MESGQKQYTRKQLIKMKNKLIELENMERRHNKFISLLSFGTIGTFSGAAISLVKYMDETVDLQTSVKCGGSCLAAASILGLGLKYITKSRNAISDEYVDLMCEAPDEVLEAVDRHFRR